MTIGELRVPPKWKDYVSQGSFAPAYQNGPAKPTRLAYVPNNVPYDTSPPTPSSTPLNRLMKPMDYSKWIKFGIFAAIVLFLLNLGSG
jgi:hypothetical protein